jgi:hypothetical protein
MKRGKRTFTVYHVSNVERFKYSVKALGNEGLLLYQVVKSESQLAQIEYVSHVNPDYSFESLKFFDILKGLSAQLHTASVKDVIVKLCAER